MPSKLSGLFRTLTWSDFPPLGGIAPGPRQHSTAARTFSSLSFSVPSFQAVAGLSPAQFRLVDNFTASAKFERKNSFVMSWVFSRSQQFQDDMLNHEQGHYNITALVARDFFVDVMRF